ncbi:RNA methyltransferase [Acidobacterium sp. S8]|uniref:RNA methyltransferase n=1 Tax=Acidobacterium sp. S8 TaxID=1641854 RepID=UPI00131E6C86|nr:TrmH family RNA methyltransferase [Acidobacterium sp. S8]
MLTDEQRKRVCVVLVRARNPNNIGAVARAMYDFGFDELRIVNDYPVPFERARSAIDAEAVLAGAREFAAVAEAVADCSLVVGTTAGGKRVHEHPLRELAEGGGLVHEHLMQAEHRVALLFGSEKTGLSREELTHCHWTMTIPMFDRDGARHPSMNLGQAAAVCLYELARTTMPVAAAGPLLAPAEDLERLTVLLGELAEVSEYTRRHPANSGDGLLRRFVRRMQMEPADAAMWMGIVRQALWKIRTEKTDTQNK